jgi:acyl-coenzyme A synthetase/AMP-(fatty) acid ligase
MTNPVEYLYFHAGAHAADTALQGPATRVDFAQLLRLVRAAAARLRLRGIGPGSTVLTMLSDKHADFVVTLAAMHEGAATASCVQHSAYPDELEPALVVADRAVRCEAPCLNIDTAWLNDALHADDPTPPRAYTDATAPFRLAFTSGTTGENKVLAHTLPALLGAALDPVLAPPAPRSINMMSFASPWGLRDALTVLMRGEPLLHAAAPADIAALARSTDVRFISGSTFQLLALAQAVQRTAQRIPSLRGIRISGSLPSTQQLTLLRSTLSPSVECRYGMSETGPATSYLTHDPAAGEGCVGHLLPGAEVEIVDDSGRVLGHGCEGRVRVRTAYMTDGYLRNPQASTRAFAGGWFYPGDLGAFDERGMLMLRGRVSEVVNRGGLRIDPARIDAVALAYPGVVDAGAFGFVSGDGHDALGIAVVAAAGLDANALLRHISATLGAALAPSHLILVPSIPRNDMGKAQRAELRRLYADALRDTVAA